MKKLYAVAVATGIAGVSASLVAVGLDKSLPYRIGLDDYSRYLWVGRLTVASLAAAIMVLLSGLAARRGLPVVLGLVGLIPLLLIGGAHSGPNPEMWCFNNLRRIDGAKEQLVQERGLTNGSSVTMADISRFIPPGPDLRCAEHGMYVIGPIGSEPRCTAHGTIPEMEGRGAL
jgi:hypothetical protein